MKTLKFYLHSLRSHFQSETDGDELYLKIDGKKIWPLGKNFQKLVDDQAKLGFSISPPIQEKGIEIELWEFDNIFSKQRLGVFKLFADQQGGPYEASLNRVSQSFCNYSLKWEAI